MSERDLLVAALVADVLGPRNGASEVLGPTENPLGEYITGVVAPRQAASVELDAQAEMTGEEDIGADDQSDPDGGRGETGQARGEIPLVPALDPQARPGSVGLSFAMEGDGVPIIDLCCTWARYTPLDERGWQRHPDGQLWAGVDCSAEPCLKSTDPGVEVRIRCTHADRQWRVSVFLLNNTACDGKRPRAEEHIFQPQIRVSLSTGMRLLPLDKAGGPGDEEDQTLSSLYRDHRPYSRGYMCAAMWRDIDPERSHPSLQAPSRSPFQWADGAMFDPEVQARFSPADVRTEYVPVVQVSAPEMTWNAGEPVPLLEPEELAESWDPGPLEAALDPLVSGYEKWIELQEAAAARLPSQDRGVAAHNLSKCHQALDRIRAGVDLLLTSTDARLAFCFANRAMALQSRWRTREQAHTWRPFQLAFQLMNLPAVADRHHADRGMCDLLWFPTGGGKTEAYLGLAAFIMALRRVQARRRGDQTGGAGVTVLSRYTLRLLTIQQFRRALAMVTACEFLRVHSHQGLRGWRPVKCDDRTDALWGDVRFAAGLWVGENVTPNGLQDFKYLSRDRGLVSAHGALSILEGHPGTGEPAQVLTCPACGSNLAVPPEGCQEGEQKLHLVLRGADASPLPEPAELSTGQFCVKNRVLTRHHAPQFSTLTLTFVVEAAAEPSTVDRWVNERVLPRLGSDVWLLAARPSRPGYFVRCLMGSSGKEEPYEFEIFCPNPACTLNTNVQWWERTVAGEWPVVDAFRSRSGMSGRCPIPAWTVDEQVYHRCPSVVVATVDKFARLPFEPKAASLFGNVESLHEHFGYFREECPAVGPFQSRSRPPGRTVSIARFLPPDLILQDELHLIDGPLGSMVGIYEAAVDLLASRMEGQSVTQPKYIASTATVRQAQEQVRALFVRGLATFPAPGITADDSFFARAARTQHPLDASGPGRLYVGIAAPGRGAQTPIRNIWARLLQHPADRLRAGAYPAQLDPFWTLVGYFNAIRELAGALALLRQDIRQRLMDLSPSPRQVDDEAMELSSRADSLRLPGMLDQLRLELNGGHPVGVVVATSMFGTGVDVNRLGLMVVHGQPKTSASYIQATGRVGRTCGGVVVTFLRAARPRDLNHYEFFTGYHNAFQRYVEPVTVYPFASRARDRALGPVAVAILRQAAEVATAAGVIAVNSRWRVQRRLPEWHCLAHEMSVSRQDPDVEAVPDLLEKRSQLQPPRRRPSMGCTKDETSSKLDEWRDLAISSAGRLLYHEPTVARPPSRPVLLGDLAHVIAGTGIAYHNAPSSLREVEELTTFEGRQ